MTISTTGNRAAYTGTGVSSAYAFNYPLRALTDLVVVVDAVEKTVGTHYTIVGASDGNGGYSSATVTMTADSGADVVLYRDTTRTQNVAFVANDPLPATSLNAALDTAMLAVQDVDAKVSRSLRAPDYAAAVDMSDFYGYSVAFDADGNPVPVDLYTGAGGLALDNGTYLKGDNTSGTPVNMWRINSANFLEPGTVISFDNTGNFFDRGAGYSQVTYRRLSPSTLHAARFTQVVGNGDNTGFKGVSGGYTVATDDASVTLSTRGVLYAHAFAVQPRVDRSNAPSDDAVCIVLTNDGQGRATEAVYVGRGAYALSNEFAVVFNNDSHGAYLLASTGAHVNGIDFHRSGAAAATFTGAVMHVPNNVTAVSGRNAANNADVSMLGINSSDRITLGGNEIIPPTNWTPTITAASGTLNSTAVARARYSKVNKRCEIDLSVRSDNSGGGTGTGAVNITLPVTPAQNGVVHGYLTHDGIAVKGVITSGSTTMVVTRSNAQHEGPTRNAANSANIDTFIVMSGSYEVA